MDPDYKKLSKQEYFDGTTLGRTKRGESVKLVISAVDEMGSAGLAPGFLASLIAFSPT